MSFISNLAAKANAVCATHNKKTIVAEHVFEAMYEAKQTQILGPIFSSTNYAKLSYAKQRDMAMKKVNEIESQKTTHKFPANEMNNMTAEEQIKEQERIFEQANQKLELEKQQNIFLQPMSVPEPEMEQAPTAIELMREQIMNIDFELASEDTDSEIMFTFDK